MQCRPPSSSSKEARFWLAVFGAGTRPIWRPRYRSSRAVGKFVGEPPLQPKRSMSSAGKSLEIRDPVVGAKRRFPIGRIAGLRKVQRFYRGKPGGVAVTTLIGFVAAELDTVSLFCSYSGSVHNIFRPLWRGLHPLD